MKPLWNNILVRIQKSETKVGGIVIPGQENTKTTKGEVLAIGDNVIVVEVGNVVFLAKEEGFPVEIDGETLYVYSDCNILGVCK